MSESPFVDCCCQKASCWKNQLLQQKPWLKSNIASQKQSTRLETPTPTDAKSSKSLDTMGYEYLVDFLKPAEGQIQPEEEKKGQKNSKFFDGKDASTILSFSNSETPGAVNETDPKYKTISKVLYCFSKSNVKDCFPLSKKPPAPPVNQTVNELVKGVSKVVSKPSNEPTKPSAASGNVKNCFAGGYKNTVEFRTKPPAGLYTPPESFSSSQMSVLSPSQLLPSKRLFEK